MLVCGGVRVFDVLGREGANVRMSADGEDVIPVRERSEISVWVVYVACRDYPRGHMYPSYSCSV